MSKPMNIKVSQKDVLEQDIQTIYEGIADLYNEDFFTVKYKEDETTEVFVKVENGIGFLQRYGETKTDINFDLEKNSKASLTSHLGKMILDVKTDEITLKKDNLVIAYSLIQEDNIVSQFVMKVEWLHE